MKKALFVLLGVMLISGVVFYVMNSKTLSKEEIVEELLTTVFTYSEKDFVILDSEEPVDYGSIGDRRLEHLRENLTPRCIRVVQLNRSLNPFSYGHRHRLTHLENLELDFRETSEPDELVCYYMFDLVLDDDGDVLTFETGGTLTLLKDNDNWKIDVFQHNSRNLYRQLYN